MVKSFILISFLAAACILFPPASSADPLDNWHWRNPLPQGHTLTKVEYLNGLFVAVGESGTIFTSSDGESWILRHSPTSMTLQDITYANGLFVAVGIAGTIITSPDGEVWTIRNTAQDSPYTLLNHVSYVDGVLVATGSYKGAAIIYTSPDGINWSITQNESYDSIGKILSGNGIYMTSGSPRLGDSYDHHIMVSNDGKTWTTAAMPETFVHANAMLFANRSFIVWADAVTTFDLYTEIVSIERVYESTDGLNWTEYYGQTSGLSDVVFGNGIFVAVRAGEIKASPSGVYWQNMPDGEGMVNDVTFGNGIFVAVGDFGIILTSTDGTNWISKTSSISYHNLWSVAYGKGMFVATGIGHAETYEDNFILTSSEGVTWQVVPMFTRSLRKVVFLHDTFVALGIYGDLLTSFDGLSWHEGFSGTERELVGVAFGNDMFIVVGSDGTVLTSPDGISWTSRNPEVTFDLTGIAFANEIFVATGYADPPYCPLGPCPWEGHGMIFTSSDGINWTQRYLDTKYSFFSRVEYRNNEFVVYNSHDGSVLTSQDGLSWTEGSIDIFSSNGGFCSNVKLDVMHAVTYGNDTCLVVGSNGAILQSDFLSGNCTATLSSDLSLHIPILDYAGSFFRADAGCQSSNGDILCRLTGYSEVDPADFSACEHSTVSPDMKLHIPAGVFENISYNADFEHVQSNDGQMWFRMTGAERN